MHKALLTFQGEEATETAKFAGMFDKFFDCLNTSNSGVGKQSRKSFKNPYRIATDFRLEVGNVGQLNGHSRCVRQWLEQQFLPYLDEWENSVRNRPGYKDDKAAQKMMLLPLETRQGILITGIGVFQAVVRIYVSCIYSQIIHRAGEICFHYSWRNHHVQ